MEERTQYCPICARDNVKTILLGLDKWCLVHGDNPVVPRAPTKEDERTRIDRSHIYHRFAEFEYHEEDWELDEEDEEDEDDFAFEWEMSNRG